MSTSPTDVAAGADSPLRGGLTLRARVLAAMGLVAVVLVVAGLVVVRTTSTHLIAQVDSQLERASGPSFGPQPGSGDRQPPQDAPGGSGVEPPVSGEESTFNTLYLGAVEGGSVVTVLTPNSDDDVGRPDVTAEQVLEAAGGAPFTVSSTEGGIRYRVQVTADDRMGTVFVTGLLLNDVDGTVQRLVLVMVIAGSVLMTTLALITWWVLRLGVRPIKEMTTAATEIASGDLSHRIPPAPPGTEAAELGDALNVMLGNIQVAFDERAVSEERLRRFVADASHELRTPVTTIRGYAELQRAGGLKDAEQLDAAMGRIEAESIRMGNLVADLLQLARLDQGRGPRADQVDLVEVLRNASVDFSTVHRDHPLVLELPSTTDSVIVSGDAELLHQIVANLLGNAGVHTPQGTTVHLRLEGGSPTGSATIVVSDEGPGMDPEDSARAFERFHRADPSRTRASGGSGLGLSIVQAVTEAHGGTVSLSSEPSDGTTVSVTLPIASQPVASPPDVPLPNAAPLLESPPNESPPNASPPNASPPIESAEPR